MEKLLFALLIGCGLALVPEHASAQDAQTRSQPAGKGAATGAEAWRYRYHNNHWWYWMPGNYWSVYLNNHWQRHQPAASASPSTSNSAQYYGSRGYYGAGQFDRQGRFSTGYGVNSATNGSTVSASGGQEPVAYQRTSEILSVNGGAGIGHYYGINGARNGGGFDPSSSAEILVIRPLQGAASLGINGSNFGVSSSLGTNATGATTAANGTLNNTMNGTSNNAFGTNHTSFYTPGRLSGPLSSPGLGGGPGTSGTLFIPSGPSGFSPTGSGFSGAHVGSGGAMTHGGSPRGFGGSVPGGR